MAKEKSKSELQKEANAAEVKANGFLSPFSTGVTYDAFLAAVPKGKTASEYLKGKCTGAEIEWLKSELEQIKNK